MQPEIAELEILEMGAEDVSGLYEIIWRFNTVWPNAAIGEKYAMADATLRRLLHEGALRIVKLKFRSGQSEYENMDSSVVASLLSDPVSWYPSLPDEPTAQLGFEITPSGEARYRELYKKVKA